MAARYWRVLVHWTDGGNEDTDELKVFADDGPEAISKAKTRWKKAVCAEWPGCRIEKVEILTKEMLRGLA